VGERGLVIEPRLWRIEWRLFVGLVKFFFFLESAFLGWWRRGVCARWRGDSRRCGRSRGCVSGCLGGVEAGCIRGCSGV
jgi:hypothetical protein